VEPDARDLGILTVVREGLDKGALPVARRTRRLPLKTTGKIDDAFHPLDLSRCQCHCGKSAIRLADHENVLSIDIRARSEFRYQLRDNIGLYIARGPQIATAIDERARRLRKPGRIGSATT